MIKGSIVKIKPLSEIAEYLHNLEGRVIKVKTQAIMKRTEKSGWNPVKVGQELICTVDLSAHSNRDLDKSLSKKFQLPERMLTLKKEA